MIRLLIALAIKNSIKSKQIGPLHESVLKRHIGCDADEQCWSAIWGNQVTFWGIRRWDAPPL